MSTAQVSLSAAPPRSVGVSGWIRRHPLPAYFILAFAMTWIFIVPLLLSQRGFSVLTLPDDLLSALYLIATFSGPLPAAFIVTGIIEGKPGARKLLGRMFQWRIGIGWYALVLIASPVVFLVVMTAYAGTAPWTAMAQNSALLLSFYLPTALMGIIFPGLGEEPGWRGFALPRLQAQFGPLGGSLILGSLHALWHLPVYFIPGLILNGPFNLTSFVGNSVLMIGMTLAWTWLFNHAGGSVLFAMVFHGVSNAGSGLVSQLNVNLTDPLFGLKLGVALALIMVIITRGRLGYKTGKSVQL